MRKSSKIIAAGLFVVLLIGFILAVWISTNQERGVVKYSRSAKTGDEFAASSGYEREALKKALKETNPGVRSAVFGASLKRWFLNDPEAALAYLKQTPHGAEYTNGLFMILGEIALADPGRALELAGEMAVRKEHWAIYNILFDQLARKSIPEALRFLEKVPAGECRDNAIRALGSRWAEKNPSEAMRWAINLTDSSQRITALESVFSVQVKKDPAGVISAAWELLEGAAFKRIIAAGVREIAASDPLAARLLVDDLPAGQVKDDASLQVVRALARVNPDDAVRWLETMSSTEMRRLALNNLLDVWAVSDPSAAKNFVSEMPEGALQDSAATQLALNLANTDPAAAFEWARLLKNASAQNDAFIAIASAWARNDPAAATRWAAEFPPGCVARSGALQGALSYWALADSEAASGFVSALPEGDQPKAILSVAPMLAQKNVGSAIAWVGTLPNEDVKEIAMNSVVTRWADNQPSDAAAWVTTQPESPARVDQVRVITEKWLLVDAAKAIDWVNALPAGPSRDGALDGLAAGFQSSDPARAVAFANSIRSSGLREARLAALAGGD